MGTRCGFVAFATDMGPFNYDNRIEVEDRSSLSQPAKVAATDMTVYPDIRAACSHA